jgi:hypothetical protein
MPNLKEEPYGVMFLLDEFPTLGKMEQFKSGIAYFRGYRVRLFLIIQDTQQLKGTYEDAGMNSFLSNSTFRITFAANNYETANLISQLCGNKTVEQTSRSKPQFFDMNPATRTMNVSEVSRALLLPQEVIQLPRDEQIILIESQPPIRSKKIFYYQDKFFTTRLLPPTFVPTQKPYDPRENKIVPVDASSNTDSTPEPVEAVLEEVQDSTNDTATTIESEEDKEILVEEEAISEQNEDIEDDYDLEDEESSSEEEVDEAAPLEDEATAPIEEADSTLQQEEVLEEEPVEEEIPDKTKTKAPSDKKKRNAKPSSKK